MWTSLDQVTCTQLLSASAENVRNWITSEVTYRPKETTLYARRGSSVYWPSDVLDTRWFTVWFPVGRCFTDPHSIQALRTIPHNQCIPEFLSPSVKRPSKSVFKVQCSYIATTRLGMLIMSIFIYFKGTISSLEYWTFHDKRIKMVVSWRSVCVI